MPHIYGCILREHPVRGESHIQRNANGEVAAVSASSTALEGRPSSRLTTKRCVKYIHLCLPSTRH